MDTSKIIAVKQEILSLEEKKIKLEKKWKVKKRNLIIGLIGIFLPLILLVYFSEDSSSHGIGTLVILQLMGCTGTIFMLIGIIKDFDIKKKLRTNEDSLQSLKKELIQLEYN